MQFVSDKDGVQVWCVFSRIVSIHITPEVDRTFFFGVLPTKFLRKQTTFIMCVYFYNCCVTNVKIKNLTVAIIYVAVYQN